MRRPFTTNALLLLSFLLWSCSSAFAQETDSEKPQKTSGRLAWFVATSIPDDLEDPVKVMTGRDITEVSLSKRSTSEPVKIPKDGIIKLVRPIADPNDPKKATPLTLAQAQISEGVHSALIILIPTSEKKNSLIYQSMVQDLADFSGGDYFYLNLTTVNVAVQLGDEKLAIGPGKSAIYKAPKVKKATNTPISYHFYHPTKKSWRLLSASTIVLRPTRREICIFSWNAQFGRVDYHGITFPVTHPDM